MSLSQALSDCAIKIDKILERIASFFHFMITLSCTDCARGSGG
ncbi:MAG: hypothetical protein VX824_01050 [Pseudomonadota bacterium]|nr:hypothetical protein [Pseudomonadota bacterium]